MRNLLYIILISIILPFLPSCAGREGRLCMDSAEEVMNTDPDSALRILRAIPKRGRSRGANEARYNMLLTEARYKADSLPLDDSLIRISVDYYEIHEDGHNAARARYLAGITDYTNNRYSPALVNFLRAEKFAGQSTDTMLCGLIYRSIGDCYNKFYDVNTALEYHKKAYDFFKKAHAINYADYQLIEIASLHIDLRNLPKAIQYYNDKLNISPKIGITWTKNKINGIKSIQIEPSAQFDIRYMPDQKKSVELYANYGISSANASMKSPDIFQQNELLYYSGNPHLKNNKEMGISLTYGFIPSNIFSLSAYAMFARTFDKMTSRYEKYLDGKALRRTYVNDGQYTYAVIGASATLSLFNRKLRMSVTPNLKIYEVTGELKNRIAPLEIQTSISYYLNNFYFSAFYMTRQKNINSLSNALVQPSAIAY